MVREKGLRGVRVVLLGDAGLVRGGELENFHAGNRRQARMSGALHVVLSSGSKTENGGLEKGLKIMLGDAGLVRGGELEDFHDRVLCQARMSGALHLSSPPLPSTPASDDGPHHTRTAPTTKGSGSSGSYSMSSDKSSSGKYAFTGSSGHREDPGHRLSYMESLHSTSRTPPRAAWRCTPDSCGGIGSVSRRLINANSCFVQTLSNCGCVGTGPAVFYSPLVLLVFKQP